ncbi:hypothetical protein TBC1_111810 [Lentimicrobium saccharophilum]|uniref:Lipoprotein n=1 Tax=Lentimicrobium saccharophilum TaxID=1678841 RepID=A0A0S7C2K9_9BACT|nr:hypothetical protein [Lentimicrobium saccharophilum]GAP43654.1 hypothetical protein TBC1_111810 [Lentimicrobium saccharophilum]
MQAFISSGNLRSGFLAAIMLTAALFAATSCSKDKDTNQDDTLGTTSWPSEWVLVTDRDADNYHYIYSNNAIILYKGSVPKSYSIKSLAEEKDCYFQFSPVAGASNNVFTIRSYQNQDHWWGIYKTNSPFGAEEWYLGIDEDDDFPVNDENRFILHFMPKQEDKLTIVIESYSKRGFYLEFLGHTFSGNGLSFVQYDKPEKATHFKMLKPFA